MVISQDKKEDIMVLGLQGRLDTLSSKSLGTKIQELIDANEHKIIIDFSELDFISSSGLRVMLTTAKQLNQLKGKLALCALKDKVKEVFDVAGFSMLFIMLASPDEAFEQM